VKKYIASEPKEGELKHKARFRRWATACLAGATSLTGLSVLGLASSASAAGTSTGTLVASSAPTINAGIANQAAGSWTLTLTPGATGTATTTGVHITVKDFNETNHVGFDQIPTVTAPSVVGNTAFAIQAQVPTVSQTPTNATTVCNLTACVIDGNLLEFGYLDGAATTVNQPIDIIGVSYDVSTGSAPLATAPAGGPVVVTGTDDDAGLTTNVITPVTTSLDGASNPYDPSASNAAIAVVTGTTLVADQTPVIPPGATTALAGPAWELYLSGIGDSWASGDKYYITVARHDTSNCATLSKPDSIGFVGTPTVSVNAQQNGATTLPTFTVSTTSSGSCATFSGVENTLILTFTNSGTITSSNSQAVDVTISGVSYAVSGDLAAGTPPANEGNIDVASGYAAPAFTTCTIEGTSITNGCLSGGSTSGVTVPGPSNADIGSTAVTVTANTPSTTIETNFTSTGAQSVNNAISNVTITEGTPGALGGGVTGYACLELQNNAEWNNSTHTPTASASGGGMAVSAPIVETQGPQTGPNVLEFQITTPSSGTPGTITLSNLAVNFPTTAGLTLTAVLYYGGVNAACSGATEYTSSTGSHLITLAYIAGRTFGQSQDDTAATEFSYFNDDGCDGDEPTSAVLVTDQSYQDALSASYLAGSLDTGIMTTPTNSLNPVVLTELRNMGTTDVYVVGGPLAFSQANVSQLQATPSYACGGTQERITPGTNQVQDLIVHWIYGQNADGTAEAVGSYPGPGNVGTDYFQGAFGGEYNHTTGANGTSATNAPDSNVSTAIVATDAGFQDAASASTIAYNMSWPLFLTNGSSLSPEAAAGLTNMAIQQVIVMGGPLAISDSVVSQIEALGIAVLRIAGNDFTDTSQLTAQFELNSVNTSGQFNGLDWDSNYLISARGDYYTDAITASSLGEYPILLNLSPTSAGTYLPGFFHQVGQVLSDLDSIPEGDATTVNNLWFIGGDLAVAPSLRSTIETDLNG
jgi:putative cell wall-binding protein